MENKQTNRLIGVVKVIDTAAFYISRAAGFICGALLAGVVIIICAGVVNRLFIHQSWMFVEEWSGLALIPMSYLSFGYAHRYNKHLKMDLIVKNMSQKWQNIMAIFAAVFSLLCLVYLIGFSYNWFDYCITRNALSSGPMQTPLWMFALSILVGMVILTLDMLGFLINRILYMATGTSPLHFYDQADEEE